MVEQFPNLTVDVVDESKWKEICHSGVIQSTHDLNSIYMAASKEAEAKGEVLIGELYKLLSQVFSMYYKNDDYEPFGPMFILDNKRSAIVTDFTDKELDILKYLLGQSNCDILNARFADVLWLRRKNREDAETAIENYISHAQRSLKIHQEKWLYGFESLDRACRLWRLIGRPINFKAKLQKIIDSCLIENDEEPNDYFRIKVLKVATSYNFVPDAIAMQVWTEKLGEVEFQKNYFNKARAYLKSSIDFAKLNKNNDEQIRLKRLYVDYFINEARLLKSHQESALLVADRYSKAIESARSHGGLRDLINELHLEMNEVQIRALGEMQPYEFSIDISDLVKMGIELIEAVPLDEAVMEIAKLASPFKIADIRKSVEKNAVDFPLMNSIGATIFNSRARVVARTGATLISDQNDKEAAIMDQVIAEYGRTQLLHGESIFESARRTLRDKAPHDYSIFESFVENNPFVPQGREGLYLKGLRAGLDNNFVVSTHILIPQLENSIRCFMELTGKLVTRLKDDFTQKEHDLNSLLFDKEVKIIFGEDLIFCLRVLLVEELGGNFRNRMAHGLLDEDDFYSGWNIYLWAITIRLLVVGRLLREKWEKEVSAPTIKT